MQVKKSVVLYLLSLTIIFIFVLKCDNPTAEEDERWQGPFPWEIFEINELPKNTSITGIYMISANYGWACADGSVFLKYTGEDWFVSEDLSKTESAAELWEIYFSQTSDGWAVGNRYKYYYTLNAGGIFHYNGDQWEDVTPYEGMGAFFSVFAHAPDDVWVGGSEGIFHYDGSSWTPWPVARFVWGLHFTSPTRGWAVTSYGTYHRWDGLSWTSVSSFDIEHRFDVFAPTPTTAWAVGGGTGLEIPPGYPIFRYDAGRDFWVEWEQDWSREYPPILNGVHFANPSDGWAAGQAIYRFDGETWNHVPTPEGFYAYDVFTLGGDEVWVGGFDRKIYKYAPERVKAAP
jgi:hypothetical protein